MINLRTLLVVLVSVLVFRSLSLAQDSKTETKLTIEEFEKKLNNAGEDAQLLDARSSEEYKLNHIKGAIDFSAANDTELQKKITLLNKKKPVFVYSIGTGRSGVLAKKLIAQGFVEVYELPGGFSRWVGSGRPVVSSTGNGLSLAEYNKLLQSDKLVLVDFGSKFCPGCQRMLPVVDSLSNENTATLKVVKIELFENKPLANELKILSLPTFILYKDGEIVWQKSGNVPKTLFEEELKKATATSLNTELK